MEKIEILSKADQIDAILEDCLEQVLREKIPDLTTYDLLRSLTFTRKDLVEHLKRRPRATSKYFDVHKGTELPPDGQTEVLHDVPVIRRESSRETLIYSSFPRKRESKLLILLGSRLRGNDVTVIDQSFPREYRVAWMDHGVMTDARYFSDLSEAVADYIMLSAGMD